jgi:aromatic ring-opening dioxygenase catalytic subunit (LigB family)
MGEIVWAAGTAHTAGMLRTAGDGEDAQRSKRVYAGWDRLKASLKAARPDVLIVVATDHFMTFEYDSMPIFAIGRGESFNTWGEGNSPKTTLRGVAPFADSIHEALIEEGFDVAGAAEMRLDHSFACPMHFLNPDGAIPILPLFVNCNVPPLPSLRRAVALGRALGEAVRAQTVAQRVAIVGTGGLSHWIGLPQTGLINEEFDLRFLDAYESGKLDAIAGWDSDKTISDAGNGVAEIRNWLVAAAAARNVRPERIAYEPVFAWKTGIALVDLRPA